MAGKTGRRRELWVRLTRKLVWMLLVLWGITIISFLVIHLAPGSPTDMETTLNPLAGEAARKRLEELYGLNRPLYVQYLDWLSRIVRLDFGISMSADARHVKPVEFALHPFEFAGETEVGHVAAVDDEVDVALGVDASDGGGRFIVPALGVADDGKTQTVAAVAFFFDGGNGFGVKLSGAAVSGVVGVVVDEVATAGGDKQAGQHTTVSQDGFHVANIVISSSSGKVCFSYL